MSQTPTVDPQDFWGKISRVPKSAGDEVIERAVTLYVLLTDGNVPLWLRGSILACLSYFLWPLDTVPDFLPGGYVDDLAAMALLLAELHAYQTPTVCQRIENLMLEKFKRRKA